MRWLCGSTVTGGARDFDLIFADHRVMAILRGYDPAATVRLCERAWSVGIAVIEVPIHTPDAVASLAAAVAAAREHGRSVGAGTVLTVEQVDLAADTGAAYTVAPGLDPAVTARSAELGLPHLPGVATATDIQAATRLDLGWLKAFPAQELGARWIAAMLGPFPNARFVATGGIDATNAASFLRAGARVVAIGSALADDRQVEQLAVLDSTGDDPATRVGPA